MIDIATLEPYFKGKKRHAAYEKTVDLYNALKLHANGEKPDKLLNDYRPSETDEIRNYRLKIYEPITKEHISQIINSVSKIRRSSDWSIRYSPDAVPAKISEEETLEQYCENNFPYYGSLTNWVFTVLLKHYLVDANAVVLITPLTTEIEANEFYKPYPIIFNSDQVYELNEKFAVLKSKEKASYKSGNAMRHDGEVFYVVDEEKIYRWEKSETGYALVSEFTHQLSKLPVIRVKGTFFDSFDKYIVYESRINSIVPRLNKVVRQDSDLDAAVVTHLYPEPWEFASQPCDSCYDANMGVCTGKVKQGNKTVACKKCSGTGVAPSTGPYKKIVVRAANINMGEQPAPIPPKGYISKPIEIVKMQSDFIDANAYKALASVNMHFLMQTPLNESGYAKEVDRDDLNNFIHAIAEDIVRMMDEIYWFICETRYKIVVPVEAERKAMLPQVTVPEKFDILSLNYMLEEITKAIEKKINPIILQSMLIEFVNKKFYNQPDVRDMLVCSLKLDPLPCKTDDEKALIKQLGGVTETDYIISCKLPNFIQRAVVEQKDFYAKTLEEQSKIMSEYAEEVKLANTGVNLKENPEDIAGGGVTP